MEINWKNNFFIHVIPCDERLCVMSQEKTAFYIKSSKEESAAVQFNERNVLSGCKQFSIQLKAGVEEVAQDSLCRIARVALQQTIFKHIK